MVAQLEHVGRESAHLLAGVPANVVKVAKAHQVLSQMIRKLQLLLLLLAPFPCGFAPAQSFEVLDGNLRVTSLDGL